MVALNLIQLSSNLSVSVAINIGNWSNFQQNNYVVSTLKQPNEIMLSTMCFDGYNSSSGQGDNCKFTFAPFSDLTLHTLLIPNNEQSQLKLHVKGLGRRLTGADINSLVFKPR